MTTAMHDDAYVAFLGRAALAADLAAEHARTATEREHWQALAIEARRRWAAATRPATRHGHMLIYFDRDGPVHCYRVGKADAPSVVRSKARGMRLLSLAALNPGRWVQCRSKIRTAHAALDHALTVLQRVDPVLAGMLRTSPTRSGPGLHLRSVAAGDEAGTTELMLVLPPGVTLNGASP